MFLAKRVNFSRRIRFEGSKECEIVEWIIVENRFRRGLEIDFYFFLFFFFFFSLSFCVSHFWSIWSLESGDARGSGREKRRERANVLSFISSSSEMKNFSRSERKTEKKKEKERAGATPQKKFVSFRDDASERGMIIVEVRREKTRCGKVRGKYR